MEVHGGVYDTLIQRSGLLCQIHGLLQRTDTVGVVRRIKCGLGVGQENVERGQVGSDADWDKAITTQCTRVFHEGIDADNVQRGNGE